MQRKRFLETTDLVGTEDAGASSCRVLVTRPSLASSFDHGELYRTQI